MKHTLKNILLIVLTAAVILGFSVLNIIKSPDAYSMTERRSLAQKPNLTTEELLSGRYMKKYEAYMQDQFIFRDSFRGLKANAAGYLFQQMDNNGYYIVNGSLSKLEYPLQKGKIQRSLQAIQNVYHLYLKDSNCSIYLSIIPDKNYYLAPQKGYPMMNYRELIEMMQENMGYAEYIDLFPLLSWEDYYTTDQHWRQEKLKKVTAVFSNKLNTVFDEAYQENELPLPFYGAYYGQAALHLPADSIHYLTNDTLDACTVTSYRTGKPQPDVLYNIEKAAEKDTYDLFLSGADALLTIENPKAKNDRECIVFRDSFGSSIAPLLASGYAKVTLIDLRYIRSDLLKNYLTFDNQDVLFLYSTLILNAGILQ